MASGKNITEILILNLLNVRPMYGAEMVEEIKKISGNTVIMSLPSLYSSLHRMADKRLVNSYQKQSTIGGRCRVYNITKYGREYLEDHPIEINYNEIANNIIDTEETTNVNKNTASNLVFSTLENSVSLPLNKTTNTNENNTVNEVIATPLTTTPQTTPTTIEQPTQPNVTQSNKIATEPTQPIKQKSTFDSIEKSAYISPTDKIITTPEPKYQQTLIGLSGTVGGSDLRPLLKLNKVKVGSDYVIINRLRVISAMLTTAIFVLINFFCSLVGSSQAEYYNIVYIILAIYAFINLAIYFVYPRIKVVLKCKTSGLRHMIISLVLFALVLLYCLISGHTNLLWLLFFTLLPIVEFIFMANLRNRSLFQC